MTIEVRQLLIRAQVGPAAPAGGASPQDLEQLRAELLAQLSAQVQADLRLMLDERLQALRER